MVPKISRVDGAERDSRAQDEPTAAQPREDDGTGVILELPGNPRRQLRMWLLAGNVIAWILIILAIRAFFF